MNPNLSDKHNKEFLFSLANNQQPSNISTNNINSVCLPKEKTSKPIFSAIFLIIIISCCLGAEFVANHDPSIFYVNNLNQSPNSEFYFGTDLLGRDIFSIIWYGGRISLFIGLLGTIILTTIGLLYGCISGLAPKFIDNLLMRFAELLCSIPSILLLICLTSLLPSQNVFTLALFIGLVNWMPLARMVRNEVLQIKNTEYFWSAKLLGISRFKLISNYLLPNFWATIIFMVISSINTCILNEAVLSFLGLGLPVDIISWGSMLSLANRALLTNSWWVIFFPGIFIVITLLCITNIIQHFKVKTTHKCSNL